MKQVSGKQKADDVEQNDFEIHKFLFIDETVYFISFNVNPTKTGGFGLNLTQKVGKAYWKNGG